jgi:hypothetical protein
MPYTKEAGPEVCATEGLDVQCLSEFGTLAPDPGKHGGYLPTCGNTTSVETPAPTISPAAVTCNLEDVAAELSTRYTHMMAVKEDNVLLFWRAADDGGDAVELAYVNRGRLGWMSVGARNVGGKHKGMNGARVVMATVDPNDEPAWVREYKIHESVNAFTSWSRLNESTTDTVLTVTGCYSLLTLRASAIGDWALNMTGPNYMLYAFDADHQNIYTTTSGQQYLFYHGRGSRGTFDVDFSSEEHRLPDVVAERQSDRMPDLVAEGASGSLVVGPTWALSVLGLVFAGVMHGLL